MRLHLVIKLVLALLQALKKQASHSPRGSMERAVWVERVAASMSLGLSLRAEKGLCWQTARNQIPLSYSHKKINSSTNLRVRM